MQKNKLLTIGATMIVAFFLNSCSSEQEPTTNEPNSNDDIENRANNEMPEEDNAHDIQEALEESIEYDNDIHDDTSITVLVNKQQSLNENYEPEDLVPVDVPTVLENPEVNQLRQEAADALKEMFDKAADTDIHLHARSGYRSYQTQVQLFNNYA